MNRQAISRCRLTALICLLSTAALPQCIDYTITVGGGTWDSEITWELVDSLGTMVANGAAPAVEVECLPDGCYTFYMYDSFGDGWNGATYTIEETVSGMLISSGTLASGYFGTVPIELGSGCSAANCGNYTLEVTAGTFPFEVSWNLVSGTSIVATGFAPANISLCLDTGCYTMQLFDSFGDGWNGAIWTLYDSLGATVQSGTLNSGSIGQANIPLGVPSTNCTNTGPVTASDCPDAVNVCTNFSFSIDPNGSGFLNEIPPLGSLGNPDLLAGDLVPSAWGSDNWGCLRNNELNSTWMIINVATGGTLEFTFGGLGTQAGFYDWIMYPYGPGTCGSIPANTLAPIRCNWNGVSFGGTGLAATPPIGGDPSNYEPPLNVLTAEQYIICFSNWSSVTTVVPLEFGGTAVISCDPIVLPIELVDLHLENRSNGIAVVWSTASEQNTERFIIERSNDLFEWRPVSTIPAAGNSFTVTEYRSLDNSPFIGENFYRLLIVDHDGTERRSLVKSTWWDGPAKVVIYPNPSNGAFQVLAPPGHLRILDMHGREVLSSWIDQGLPGSIQLDRTGAYTLQWTGVYDREVQRILVTY